MATVKQNARKFVVKRNVNGRDKFKIGDIAYVVNYEVVDKEKSNWGNYKFPKRAKELGFNHGTKVVITNILQSKNTENQGNTYQVVRHDNTSSAPKKQTFRSVMLWKENDFINFNLQYNKTYDPNRNEFFAFREKTQSAQLELNFKENEFKFSDLIKSQIAILESEIERYKVLLEVESQPADIRNEIYTELEKQLNKTRPQLIGFTDESIQKLTRAEC